MFHLETDFFSWNFFSWTVNFLFAALSLIIASLVLRRKGWLIFSESKECGEDESETFTPFFESQLKMLRHRTVDFWLTQSYILAMAPFFFLVLFLAAVRAG